MLMNIYSVGYDGEINGTLLYNIYKKLMVRCKRLTQLDAIVGDILVIDQYHAVVVNILSLQELVCESSVDCPSLVKDWNINVSFCLTMILELS